MTAIKATWHEIRRSFCREFGKQKVRVYRNLNDGCLSVQTKVLLPDGTRDWRVTHHLDSIKLEKVEFKVVESGHKRTLAEQRKNVHAYVIGYPTEWSRQSPRTRCTYNPYRWDTFVVRSSCRSLERAKCCVIDFEGIKIR